MSSGWITINPYSLFDLVVFTISAPLAVAFYLIYLRLGKRPIDLIFANLLLCTAVYAFSLLMADNASTGSSALRWTRMLYIVGAVEVGVLIHFIFEFIGEHTPTSRRIILVSYALGSAMAAMTYSPLFLKARNHPSGPRTWFNVAPWLPEAGPLQAMFTLFWFAMNVYAVVKLSRSLSTLPPMEERATTHSLYHIKPLRFGFIVLMVTGLFSALLMLNSVYTIDMTPIGILAICFPAAIALAQQVLQKERLKDALSKFVAPHLADEIIDKGLHIGGEAREVTILFSDIRNFTAMSEKMLPEEVVHLLSQYFDAMAKTIFEQGGMLNKTIGDGLLAIFGAPKDLDNHALAAVKSAWEMQTALDRINAALQERGMSPIRVGIGLHSGSVVIGNVGGQDKIDYTAIGDVVNVASRVEQYTKVAHCPILVTAETYEKVKPFVRAESAEEAPVRLGERSVLVLAITNLQLN